MDEVSTWVDARPERVWALISDVTRYGEWSPENQGARWATSMKRGVGAKFVGANKHGKLRWKTKCTVIEYQQNARFAFEVAESKTQWGFQLEEVDGGTRITQWRNRIGLPPLPIRWLENSGLLGKPRETWIVNGMKQTLEAIKQTLDRERALT